MHAGGVTSVACDFLVVSTPLLRRGGQALPTVGVRCKRTSEDHRRRARNTTMESAVPLLSRVELRRHRCARGGSRVERIRCSWLACGCVSHAWRVVLGPSTSRRIHRHCRWRVGDAARRHPRVNQSASMSPVRLASVSARRCMSASSPPRRRTAAALAAYIDDGMDEVHTSSDDESGAAHSTMKQPAAAA
jgi:hypothetical protein